MSWSDNYKPAVEEPAKAQVGRFVHGEQTEFHAYEVRRCPWKHVPEALVVVPYHISLPRQIGEMQVQQPAGCEIDTMFGCPRQALPRWKAKIVFVWHPLR